MSIKNIEAGKFITIGSDMSNRVRSQGQPFDKELRVIPSDMSNDGRQGKVTPIQQVEVVK